MCEGGREGGRERQGGRETERATAGVFLTEHQPRDPSPPTPGLATSRRIASSNAGPFAGRASDCPAGRPGGRARRRPFPSHWSARPAIPAGPALARPVRSGPAGEWPESREGQRPDGASRFNAARAGPGRAGGGGGGCGLPLPPLDSVASRALSRQRGAAHARRRGGAWTTVELPNRRKRFYSTSIASTASQALL